jgi:aspartate ammonia-lyase
MTMNATRTEHDLLGERQVPAGNLHSEFVADVIQGGAGTSTNINANEVTANRVLESLGDEKGHYDVLHPLNHVNMSQSTNDVYPTALRIMLSMKLERLRKEMDEVLSPENMTRPRYLYPKT